MKNASAPNILFKIAETARRRVQAAEALRSLALLEEDWRAVRPIPKPFAEAFRHDWNVIAEVKKASPSQGDIAADIDHLLVAQDYLSHGAAALSVLTEPFFFKGRMEYLTEIRAAFRDAYLLQKDFVVDPYQIYEAALSGVDAVLLIVAMLGASETEALHRIAESLGLSVLVEVHDREELEIAKAIGAKIIGINNRNLKDMTISLDTSRDLIRFMPKDAIAVAESGLVSHKDLVELKALGFQAFLVGTQLMKDGEPGRALEELIQNGR